MSDALPTKDLLIGSIVLTAVSLAMLMPMLGPLEDDSFPLSTFPMFTHHRGQPLMHQLVAIDADGKVTRLAPELLGTSEVLQAKALIERAARSRARRARLCERVAERVAQDARHTTVEHLELRRVRFDPIAYFSTGPTPLEDKRLYRCRIPRPHKAGSGGEKPKRVKPKQEREE